MLVRLMLPLLLAAAARSINDPSVVASPGLGSVRGRCTDDFREFLGIPFGVAPTGDLRWRPPLPAPPFSATFDATHYGPECYQAIDKAVAGVNVTVGEDCLRLSIYTPAPTPAPRSSGQAAAGGLPVIAWIHGGSYTTGGNNEMRLNGTYTSSSAFWASQGLTDIPRGVVTVMIQ